MQSNRQLIKDGAMAENLWSYVEDDAALSDAGAGEDDDGDGVGERGEKER